MLGRENKVQWIFVNVGIITKKKKKKSSMDQNVVWYMFGKSLILKGNSESPTNE